jgi:hypothetical protein
LTVDVVDALPRSHAGKVERFWQTYAAHAASPVVEPLSPLLELADEVLGIRCEPDENFFDHGDSIAAVQLCALGARRYGWTITARDVFAWESFALLARMIERDEAEHAS